MAITANSASNPSAGSVDTFLHKNVDSIPSWADQCEDGDNYKELQVDNTYSLSEDFDEGWNKVKSKSERLESRSRNRSATNDHYCKYQKRKSSQHYNQKYYQHQKSQQDSGYEYSPKGNCSNSDLQASSESGESDFKQTNGDAQNKPEFINAPVPKVNPWSRYNGQVKCRSSSPTSTVASTKHTTKSQRKVSQRLPSTCGWGEMSNQMKSECFFALQAYYCFAICLDFHLILVLLLELLYV